MVLRIPFLIELELEMLVLGRGGKTGVKGEKPLGIIQQLTQPRYGVDTGSRTQATLVGGACSHHFVTLSSDEAVRPL